MYSYGADKTARFYLEHCPCHDQVKFSGRSATWKLCREQTKLPKYLLKNCHSDASACVSATTGVMADNTSVVFMATTMTFGWRELLLPSRFTLCSAANTILYLNIPWQKNMLAHFFFFIHVSAPVATPSLCAPVRSQGRWSFQCPFLASLSRRRGTSFCMCSP